MESHRHIIVGTHKAVVSDIKGRWGKDVPERMSKHRWDKRSLVWDMSVGSGWALEKGTHTPVSLQFHSALKMEEAALGLSGKLGKEKPCLRLTFCFEIKRTETWAWVTQSNPLLATTLSLTKLVFQWFISDSFDRKLLSQLLTDLSQMICLLRAEVVVRKRMWQCHNESERTRHDPCLPHQVLCRLCLKCSVLIGSYLVVSFHLIRTLFWV